MSKKPSPRTKFTEAQRQVFVKDFEASGKTMSAFCRLKGISLTALKTSIEHESRKTRKTSEPTHGDALTFIGNTLVKLAGLLEAVRIITEAGNDSVKSTRQ